ncbi:MAG: cytochrome c biogenesis protein CcsA [Phycisphaerae bacterium]|nr:cytochrome c biogenesis protein CcsA [Phycisphaerae bacterium]
MNNTQGTRQFGRRRAHGARGLLVCVLAVGFARMAGPAAGAEGSTEGASSSTAATQSSDPAASLRAIQDRVDVRALGLLPMLDNNSWRYSTVDSWSRKVVQAIYGPGDFEGLDPVVAAMELLFNVGAYHDQPVLYVKDLGVLRDLTKYPIEVSDGQRRQILKSKRISYDFFTSPAVSQRLQELSGEVMKNKAMGRLGTARFTYERLPSMFTIVPCPNGARETPWIPVETLLNAEGRAKAGISLEQARPIVEAYRNFGLAWLNRDLGGINEGISKLSQLLPTLAPAGVYPPMSAREAELKYRRYELIKKGWGVYIVAFFVSIFAVATRYRWARLIGVSLLAVALGLHGYDLWMRWEVVGRVPVANMYEAVVSSAWMASLLGFLLELFTRKRVYLLGSAFLGFFALALPELLPDQVNNNLQTMMPILDDIMLRIHTVLIIASYGVITLAYAAANCYLVVSAWRDRSALARVTIGAQIGAVACLFGAYGGFFDTASSISSRLFGLMGVVDEDVLLVWQFIGTLILSMAGCSLLSLGLFGVFGGSTGNGRIASISPADFPVGRDVLEEFDLAQRVLIYTSMVALFVGIVLGAIWADYSWGRPWGWDPKEVFALNTWLVYAVLIHVRFVTKRRALWTSVLSVLGFAAMQFNWWVVNFYIVGLHSYA